MTALARDRNSLPDGWAHQSIDVDGVSLHLVTAGPPDGPPLLFLHGFPEYWYGWRDQIDYFARAGYRVIAPDQRGYGESDKPDAVSAYHIDRLAADIAAVIEALGYPRVDLVGHDWGGIVTWRLLENHAGCLRRVVIMNAPHLWLWRRKMLRSPRQMLSSWYVLMFQLPWLPERIMGLGGGGLMLMLSGLGASLDGESRSRYRRAYAGSLKTMIHWYRAAMRAASEAGRPPARPIETEMLLLWGRRDSFLSPELAHECLELCTNARLQFLDDASHWLAHERPAEVNQAIHAFIEESDQ